MLDMIERVIWWLGAAAAALLCLVVLVSTLRAGSRRMSRAAGRTNALMHAPWFIALGIVLFGAIMILLWRPIVPSLPDWARIALLVIGGPLYFGGIAVALWGRVALGEMHNVSSSFGAELFEGHRLITSGPYAFVRNPMYVGAFGWGLGGLLMYHTWAMALIAVSMLVFIRRARREEEALSAQFGDAWAAYARRVPAWLPRLNRAGGSERKEVKPA